MRLVSELLAGDPIGGCEVTPAGFAAMTALLASVAPLALILEGGYNLSATASGVEVRSAQTYPSLPPTPPPGPRLLAFHGVSALRA